jgi:hypothetical protein
LSFLRQRLFIGLSLDQIFFILFFFLIFSTFRETSFIRLTKARISEEKGTCEFKTVFTSQQFDFKDKTDHSFEIQLNLSVSPPLNLDQGWPNFFARGPNLQEN